LDLLLDLDLEADLDLRTAGDLDLLLLRLRGERLRLRDRDRERDRDRLYRLRGESERDLQGTAELNGNNQRGTGRRQSHSTGKLFQYQKTIERIILISSS
jgi:hypothetical protein